MNWIRQTSPVLIWGQTCSGVLWGDGLALSSWGKLQEGPTLCCFISLLLPEFKILTLQHTPLWISPCTILRASRSSLCFCCQETNSGGIWCLLHLSSLSFVWNTLSQVTVPQLLLAPICLRAIGPGLMTVLVLFLFVCLNLFIFLSSHWVSQLQTHRMSRSTSLPYAAFPGSIQPTMCLTLCAKHYKIRIFIWKYWVNSCFTYRQMSVCKLMETLPSCFTGDRINTQLTQSLD